MRIAVIGTNFITDRFLEAARLQPDFTLAAVCGSSVEKATAFAAKYDPNVPVFGDWRQLADLPGLEGVYIASPNQLHHPMTLYYLERKIPVLCEKPLAPNLAQVQEMIACARRNSTLLIEAIVPLFIPNFAHLRASLPRLGVIRKSYTSYCQYSSRYDSYRNGVVLNAFRPEYMGGSLLDIGIYPLYQTIALFGKPHSIAATAHLLQSGVDGSGNVLLGYHGMEATVAHSKVSDTVICSEVQGEDGSLVFNTGSNPQWLKLQLRGKPEEDITVPQHEERMYYELTEFIRCHREGLTESPLAPFSLCLEVYAVTDEVRRQIGMHFSIDK